MRIDLYLNAVCLMKSRSMAKEACDRGKITLNGSKAKASASVHTGDRIGIDVTVRVMEIEVTALPPKAVAKKRAPEYYHVLRDERPLLD